MNTIEKNPSVFKKTEGFLMVQFFNEALDTEKNLFLNIRENLIRIGFLTYQQRRQPHRHQVLLL